MKTMMVCASVGALFATCAIVQHCNAAELPAPSVCNIISELAYQAADDAGDPLPDGAYERAQGECEWDADFGAGVPLNELVAVDGEPVWPVCMFEGGCVR